MMKANGWGSPEHYKEIEERRLTGGQLRNEQAEKEVKERICPFCGQIVMAHTPGEGAENTCECDKAIRYRTIAQAIDDFCGPDCSEESPEFREMVPAVLEDLHAIAKMMVQNHIASAKLVLPDGSVLSLAGKVTRAVSVKVTTEVR